LMSARPTSLPSSRHCRPPHPLSPSVRLPPAPTPSSPLSLHDALPICLARQRLVRLDLRWSRRSALARTAGLALDADIRCPALRRGRKSTRLNSSHVSISYAVFWLKKRKWDGRNGPPTGLVWCDRSGDG